jgi:environmental stress-induced protein Ves
MSLRLIPANEYRRERWRNGLGWTKVIFTEGAANDWDWRLSIAEIATDCPFSAFPGCDRVLVLLAGNGMRLAFDDGTHAELAPPHGRAAFAGERAVQCHLLDGPTADFNAIVRRDRCTMQVYHRPLVGSMVFFAETGVLWAIHLISGRATIKFAGDSVSLNAADTVLLDSAPSEAAARSILDGGGDVLLVRLQRSASHGDA